MILEVTDHMANRRRGGRRYSDGDYGAEYRDRYMKDNDYNVDESFYNQDGGYQDSGYQDGYQDGGYQDDGYQGGYQEGYQDGGYQDDGYQGGYQDDGYQDGGYQYDDQYGYYDDSVNGANGGRGGRGNGGGNKKLLIALICIIAALVIALVAILVTNAKRNAEGEQVDGSSMISGDDFGDNDIAGDEYTLSPNMTTQYHATQAATAAPATTKKKSESIWDRLRNDNAKKTTARRATTRASSRRTTARGTTARRTTARRTTAPPRQSSTHSQRASRTTAVANQRHNSNNPVYRENAEHNANGASR